MNAPPWRGYSREDLDRELNLRQRTPEYVAFFARWAAESAAARRDLAVRLDLAYGEAPDERLDYFPAASAAAPLLLFIHGGYWQTLDKSDFSFLARPFLAAGIAFASLNYSLAPAARIPEMVTQTRRSIAWLHGAADDLGFDRDRLVVAGHSAGGHLATMALITDWERDYGLPANVIKGGCSVSGIYQLEPLRQSYHQPFLQLDDASVRDMSPQRNIPPRAAPLLLAVGSEEPDEFRRQQGEFAAAWRQAGLELLEVALPGRHHFSAADALGETDHPLHVAACHLVRATALNSRDPIRT